MIRESGLLFRSETKEKMRRMEEGRWKQEDEEKRKEEEGRIKLPSERIAYKFNMQHHPEKDIIFVNIIPQYACVNSCIFCERKRRVNNIYEEQVGHPLWLERKPSIEETIEAIRGKINKSTEEITFVGMGEPFVYFDDMVRTITKIKKEFSVEQGYSYMVRDNTNGLIYHIHGYKEQARTIKEAGLDEIRISVNAINSEDYKMLCNPPKGDGGNPFSRIMHFIIDCKAASIDTKVSFVTGYDSKGITTRSPEDYFAFAQSIGIAKADVILRQYTTSRCLERENIIVKNGTIEYVVKKIDDIRKRIPYKQNITTQEIRNRLSVVSGVKVAYKDKKNVGFMVWHEKNSETAYIWIGLVDETNSGIGSSMLDSIIEDTNGYRMIEAKTTKDNYPCRRMLEKKGFNIETENEDVLTYRMCSERYKDCLKSQILETNVFVRIF